MAAADRREDADRLADADAEWQSSVMDLHAKFRDDQDHGTMAERFGAELDRRRDRIAETLDPAPE